MDIASDCFVANHPFEILGAHGDGFDEELRQRGRPTNDEKHEMEKWELRLGAEVLLVGVGTTLIIILFYGACTFSFLCIFLGLLGKPIHFLFRKPLRFLCHCAIVLLLSC